MRVIFVRHSEPDQSMLDRCENSGNYSGFGRDLAPLIEHGRHLARELAKKEAFYIKSQEEILKNKKTPSLR